MTEGADSTGMDRCARLAMLVAIASAIRRRRPSAVANALVAYPLTYLPRLIECRYDVAFRPWQRLYLHAALLGHSVGMLGPYDEVWWWDHVTHTLSASLVGGAVHAIARRRRRNPRPRVVAAVVLGGLLWEALEFVIHAIAERVGVEPLLVNYGRHDTAMDLLFDVAGAALVLAFGDRLLSNLVTRPDDPSPGRP